MSTITAEPNAAGPTIDLTGTTRVPFSRLVKVELRKLSDTRAGRWLLGITGGLLVVAMAIALLVAVLNDLEMGFNAWQQVFTAVLSLLLPTVAIMSVTQEWGQRTSLVTFALEPGRARVIAAKLVAVVGLAVTTLLLAAALAVLGNLLFEAFSSESANWAVDWRSVTWAVYSQLAFFVMAFGFGMVFLNTPAAVVLYYVVALFLPLMVYGPIYGLVSWGPDVIPWIDLGFAVAPFTSDAPKPDSAVAQVVVTSILWVVVPFVVGLARVHRIELK